MRVWLAVLLVAVCVASAAAQDDSAGFPKLTAADVEWPEVSPESGGFFDRIQNYFKTLNSEPGEVNPTPAPEAVAGDVPPPTDAEKAKAREGSCKVQDCAELTCQNGGHFDLGACVCLCAPGFAGKYCERCADDWCKHGGKADMASGCACTCGDGWSGATCEMCERTCSHGTLDAAACTCKCDDSWSGATCDTCPLVCKNGGIMNREECTCQCVENWKGGVCDQCELACFNGGKLNKDECACECPAAWDGATCSAPHYVSVQSFDFPEMYMVVDGDKLVLQRVNPSSKESLRKRATFKVTEGLGDLTALSLESAAKANHFVRHKANSLALLVQKLNYNDKSFQEDATWVQHKGLADKTWVSLDSLNNPGYRITHNKHGFSLLRASGQAYRESATFHFSPALFEEEKK